MNIIFEIFDEKTNKKTRARYFRADRYICDTLRPLRLEIWFFSTISTKIVEFLLKWNVKNNVFYKSLKTWYYLKKIALTGLKLPEELKKLPDKKMLSFLLGKTLYLQVNWYWKTITNFQKEFHRLSINILLFQSSILKKWRKRMYLLQR